MISPEEKKIFLDEIIPFIADPLRIPEKQQKIYDFLIRDTNGGKLYKYRSFDNEGYSLCSLTNQTLHCSKPTKFNDPFDCRLGITYTSFAEAVMNYTEYNQLFKEVENCIRGAKPFEECKKDVQFIVRVLFSMPGFVALVNDLKRKRKKATIEEYANFFKELTKATYSYFLVARNYPISDKLMQYIDNMDYTEYLKLGHPPTFSDHLESLGFHLIEGDEITNVREFFRLQKITDDSKLTAFDETFSNLEQEVADKLADAFRIGCLAGDPYNRLMWSHYGDSHRGFCIEYDVNDIIKKNLLVLPVYYSQSRPLVSWDPVADPKGTTSLTTTINAIWALLTKDECWEYENEWRILQPSQLPIDIGIPINAVYLGASICPDHKEAILTIAKEHNIPVKQMKTDRGEYKLHAECISFKELT